MHLRMRSSAPVKSNPRSYPKTKQKKGKRALLNFGHTFAHAIENCLGYGEWLHGEAVAAGMVMAAQMSDIDQGDRDRIAALITSAGLPVAPPNIAPKKMKAAMEMDKKVQAKQLRFVLLRSIGDAYVTSEYSESRLSEVLQRGDGRA